MTRIFREIGIFMSLVAGAGAIVAFFYGIHVLTDHIVGF